VFSFFKKLINKNKEDSAEFRAQVVERIKSKRIRYVSERVIDAATGEVVDTIIGKEGFFSVKNNELEIYLSGVGKTLFRAYIPDLKAYELLSLEGVVMEAVDLISGKHRQIIAYYKYYR